MRYLIILLLLASLASADEIFSKNLNETNDFKLNSLDYEFDYSVNSDKALIEGKYLKLILSLGECEQKGYFTFCLTNATQLDMEHLTKYQLTVNQVSCLPYKGSNSTCKIKISKNCTEDDLCESNKCLHNICTFRYPICGDGFCDKSERCKEDCEIKVNETIETNDTNQTETHVNEAITADETVEQPAEDTSAAKETIETEQTEIIVETIPESNIHKTAIIWISILSIIISIIWAIFKYRKKHQYDL